jgi:hypothetical protein
MTTVKPSHKRGDRNLITPYPTLGAEKLLCFWANLADPAGNFGSYVGRLTMQFPHVFHELRSWHGIPDTRAFEPGEVNFFRSFWSLREQLRSV